MRTCLCLGVFKIHDPVLFSWFPFYFLSYLATTTPSFLRAGCASVAAGFIEDDFPAGVCNLWVVGETHPGRSDTSRVSGIWNIYTSRIRYSGTGSKKAHTHIHAHSFAQTQTSQAMYEAANSGGRRCGNAHVWRRFARQNACGLRIMDGGELFVYCGLLPTSVNRQQAILQAILYDLNSV